MPYVNRVVPCGAWHGRAGGQAAGLPGLGLPPGLGRGHVAVPKNPPLGFVQRGGCAKREDQRASGMGRMESKKGRSQAKF